MYVYVYANMHRFVYTHISMRYIYTHTHKHTCMYIHTLFRTKPDTWEVLLSLRHMEELHFPEPQARGDHVTGLSQ